ncbi:MAG: amidase, partial [Myxococcota bacterium]
IKDLFGVPKMPIFAGTRSPLPETFETPGPVVDACLRQMGVVMGKTHTVEFAFGGVGTNAHWGTPKNPWSPDVHRVPGGSSAGAGVSLCEGSALVALGTDTAGSVRIPASATGNVGLKTTIGRWSMEGIVPLSPTLDTAGILTRTVADAAYAFSALDPVEGWPNAPRLAPIDLGDVRLAIPEKPFWLDCSPGVAEITKAAIDELATAGAQLRSVRLPDLEALQSVFEKGALTAVQLYHYLQASLPDALERLDDNVRRRLTDAGALPAAEYLRRRDLMAQAVTDANAALADGVILASPTLAITPPRLDELEAPGVYRTKNLLMLRNTSMPSLLGLCALSIPIGLDNEGMPVGLQLAARGGDDLRLLRVGLAVEALLGTNRLARPTP